MVTRLRLKINNLQLSTSLKFIAVTRINDEQLKNHRHGHSGNK